MKSRGRCDVTVLDNSVLLRLDITVFLFRAEYLKSYISRSSINCNQLLHFIVIFTLKMCSSMETETTWSCICRTHMYNYLNNTIFYMLNVSCMIKLPSSRGSCPVPYAGLLIGEGATVYTQMMLHSNSLYFLSSFPRALESSRRT